MDDLSFLTALRDLKTSEGPFLSLYLNTETRDESGVEELQLRWRNLRAQAQGQASDTVLNEIEGIVSRAHQQGDGLVVLSAGDDVVFRRYLRRGISDSITFGPLPHLLPLIEWGQENPRHIALLIDKVGADIYVVHPDRQVEVEIVEGDKPDIGHNSRGGWSQPRYQRGHTKAWRDNAQEVAAEFERITKKEDVDLVLLAGDVEALRFFKESLPEQTGYLYQELDGSRQLQLADIEEELSKSIAAFTAQSVDALLEKFVEERGQRDLAVEGLEATLESLRMAQVDTLLIAAGGVQGTAYFSQGSPSQAASDRKLLTDLNLADVEEGEATDVLVAAAVASGAKVRVIPDLSEAHGPAQGVGGILRFAT